MDTSERALGLRRPRAAWRWAANGVTICILALGLAATAVALWPAGSRSLAAGLVVVAALVDGADGALARRAGGPTRTGAVLDVLADLSAFGLAPVAIAAASGAAQAPSGVWLVWPALAVYLAAGAWRLVRSARLALRKPAGLYVGLPMPTAGCLLAGLALNLPGVWVAAGVLLISLLAVSRRPYPSVPWMWRRRPASLVGFVAAAAVVLVVAPPLGLLFAAGVCAAYPWVRRVTTS